jgi:DNA-binding MarR family transcriptional regulator
MNSDESIEVLAETLWQLWRLWSERSNTPEKLSPEQYWVLRTLEREVEMSVSGLAQLRGVTPSAISIATRRMESAGWVARRRPAENQRQVLVQLTERGRELWLRVSTERQRVLRMLLRTLSPDEQETLLRIAHKMRGLLQPDDGDPMPTVP